MVAKRLLCETRVIRLSVRGSVTRWTPIMTIVSERRITMKRDRYLILSLLILTMLLLPFSALADYNATKYYASGIPQVEKMEPNGEFVISVLLDGKWKEAGRLSFDTYFRERDIDLGGLASGAKDVKVKLIQKGGGAAHVDAAFLGVTPPAAVEGAEDGVKKLSRADFDVADASGKEMLVTFPEGIKDKRFRLTARVEAAVIGKTPFQFPADNLFKEMSTASKFYTYEINSGNSFSPIFKEFSPTGTGHPSGYTYGYVRNDDKNLYVKLDFTPDNTMDGDKDYAKVYVKTKTGLREFRLSMPETTWGKPDFTYTDKVSYQHKVYDFKIPFKELGIEDTERDKEVQMAFAAYGTAGGPCSTSISIPASGTATPYPSNIVISGLPGTVTRVTPYLMGMKHTAPSDLDILLVGPGGQNLILMSDAGQDFDISSVSLYFSDTAASFVPESSQIAGGPYKPTNYGSGDSFPEPAPSPSTATTLATFAGTNPNGTWKLYVVDDMGGDYGSMNSWCLNISTAGDLTPPVVSITNPPAAAAVQDKIILAATATDGSGVDSVSFFIRAPNGGNGTPIGLEGLDAQYNSSTGKWRYNFDTTQLQDGYYVVLAEAIDNYDNAGWSSVVPFSIRNWSVIDLLPSTPTSKAGRTIPVKFTLRVDPSVDPEMPFLYNEELEIRIYRTSNPGTILQTSILGDRTTDYRIIETSELYITNFKTPKQPAEYTVEVRRMDTGFVIGSFTFETSK